MAIAVFDPVELANFHLTLKRNYEETLSKEDKKLALKDPHSKRPPRFCGLTVHFTIGCPYQCAYCYIYDMGFPITPKPYPLSPKQLVYAILNNPNFIAGRFGTLIAIGAVSEPFIFPDKAYKFLVELSKLQNPLQFSTKSYISPDLAHKLSKLNTSISPLVTIITLNHHDVLEPYAPSPELRLQSIRNLADVGFKVCVFIRPIIMGINDNEVKEIMLLAKDAGAKCVIIGSFRITYSIYNRFENLGLDIAVLKKKINLRLLRKFPQKQFVVPLPKSKKNEYIRYAHKIGLIPFKSACCANSFAAGVICPSICFETGFCTYCPNQCWKKPRPPLDRVMKALSILERTNIKISKNNERLLINNKKYRWLVQVLSRRITAYKPDL